MTKEERLTWQREYRKNTSNSHTKAYEKTMNGYLMRMYRNMKSRVSGVQTSKAHLYVGKELLDKTLFYEFAKHSPMFLTLFYSYESQGYNQKLAPTPDRIDSSKGYSFDNIQWVTHSVNSSRGALAKAAKNSLYS